MNSLNNISPDFFKAFFALIVILGVVVGFFSGLIPVEVFTGIVGTVLSYYFESQKTNIVQKQLDRTQVELQQLKSAEIVELQSDKKKTEKDIPSVRSVRVRKNNVRAKAQNTNT